jgi:hypothetical protein
MAYAELIAISNFSFSAVACILANLFTSVSCQFTFNVSYLH